MIVNVKMESIIVISPCEIFGVLINLILHSMMIKV